MENFKRELSNQLCRKNQELEDEKIKIKRETELLVK